MTGRVVDVRFEHLTDAIGTGLARPRLSWRLVGNDPQHQQSAYEIEVVRDTFATHRSRTISTESVLVPWPSVALEPRERAAVRVRVWAGGQVTDWSAPATVERSIGAEEWVSDMVCPSLGPEPEQPRPAYLLRAEFALPDDVVRTRAYVTAHGAYDLEVNGAAVGDEVLAPGWTSYRHRLHVRTVDLDSAVRPGGNAIGAWLGDGWFRGRLGFNGGLWDVYGTEVGLLLQLEVLRGDGRRDIVPLTWTWTESPITASGLYEGETHDQRLARPGWSEPRHDARSWQSATVVPRPTADLVTPNAPPVRVIEELAPLTVDTLPDGRVRLDFGQNICGRLRFAAIAPAGHVLEVHHAEVLEGGELSTRPLRSATSVDRYTFAGSSVESWEPRFTLHGFRYAELRGWPADQDPGTVRARVVHSDMSRIGDFSADHDLLDRFHQNVVWSMRDNFVGLPTDCPQRDERLGWTGDIQVFAPAAAFLYDATAVLLDWLHDLGAEQAEYGSVRNFHPWLECGFPADPAAGWGDAAVLVPWTLFERTGDLEILRTQLPSMKAWVEQVHRLTGGTGLWDRGFQLGDWLDPQAPPDRPGESATDPHLVATAYHARSAEVLARACELLDVADDARRYRSIAERAAAAFREQFVSPAGRLVSDTVTAHSIALVFDLLDTAQQRQTAGRRLVDLVGERDHLIATGFLGTPLVCDALVRAGAIDTAYHLLLQTRCPSWLYPVTMGATTVWERWDSMLPDGQVNPGEMTSFNHYALGAVVDFLHRVVAGIAPAEPGYRRILLEPRPGGGLTEARAFHTSPWGRIESSWRREGRRFHLSVVVPNGSSGEVVLPDGSREVVGPGRHEFVCRSRPATEDPQMPRRWNIHNPEDRRAMENATSAAEQGGRP